MSAKSLTKAEMKWIAELQELLNACPSKRLGAYTIGDPVVTIFDRVVRDAWLGADAARSEIEAGAEIDQSGSDLNVYLRFPFQIESRSG